VEVVEEFPNMEQAVEKRSEDTKVSTAPHRSNFARLKPCSFRTGQNALCGI
jgi:hypothetical protein